MNEIKLLNLEKKTRKHKPDPLALYIHWPFCLSKCPYCDFNSHVAQIIPQETYAHALLQELRHAISNIENYKLTSIFFGGGTPSLMDPITVHKLIDYAINHLPVTEDLEITLEANPTSVEIQKLKDFQQAGVNRISLGIQSLNQQALQRLGRQHDARQAIDALTLAKRLFPRISFDLIYAREEQTLSEWQKELKMALDLAHDHLSLYQLTIESGTVFAKYEKQGKLSLPDEKLSSELLIATEEMTHQYGMYNYEISNYAKIGAESRHNLAYWRYQDYIGIGPGAHGRITENAVLYATERKKNPKIWLELVQKNGNALIIKEALNSIDKAREMILMGLRLKEGVDSIAFQKKCNMTLTNAIDMKILEALVEEDYIFWDQKRLKTTPTGSMRLNAILDILVK